MVRSAVVRAPMTDPKAHVSDNSENTEKRHAPPTHVESNLAPVIRSKIQPPALRADTLTRERLVKRLDDALKSRVVLVVADAGYGKTTLLADYAARSGLRTLWYRLGSSDADSVTWANYLVAACREVDPSFGGITAGLLASASAGRVPSAAFIESFLGELGRWHDAPTLLVLDDYHEVDNNLEVAEIVNRLIEDGPPWLQLIVSARRRPTLRFGKLAVAADLSELRTDDLRFSPSETAKLFAEGYSQRLSEEVISQLDRRTRGWAASLQLFHGSVRGKSSAEVARVAESLSGASGPLYDYLAEEVLANVPGDLANFLVRVSILDPIDAAYVGALLEEDGSVTRGQVAVWLGTAVRLGLLSRYGLDDEVYELHPLLRDYLLRQLDVRLGSDDIRMIHERLGRAMSSDQPLRACHHLIAAGLTAEAMACLGASVLATVGSGQWGTASKLLDELKDVPAGAAVAAIRARQLTSEGNPAAAARLLDSLDVDRSSPEVRAVVRQTRASVAWRMGDRQLLRTSIRDTLSDPETPPTFREIAEFISALGTTSTEPPKSLEQLAGQAMGLGNLHRQSGRHFFSGVGFHNACVLYLNAAEYGRAVQASREALEAFEKLGFALPEATATHTAAATALFELGRDDEARAHAELALNGVALADVPAELAVLYAILGLRDQARECLARADTLVKQGRAEISTAVLVDSARAELSLPDDPGTAIELLGTASDSWPLNVEVFHRQWQLAEAYLLAGNAEACLSIATSALAKARLVSARRAEVRLDLLVSLASGRTSEVEDSMARAWSTSRLALPEFADAICQGGRHLSSSSPHLVAAIEAVPERWLNALRRQLSRGAPDGLTAAMLLDRFGVSEDVPRLRAFARTYRKRGASGQLGIAAARRSSPRLVIHDLGRVHLQVGDRIVPISAMRRKAASLMVYLATRQAFTANREQVLDELWPEADPASGINSLNQSLYFLRREIDPWYEDELSVDYVVFGGDLLWLDPELVSTDSSKFLQAAKRIRAGDIPGPDVAELIRLYVGTFAPEFEYEEWAIDWRSRVHSAFLEAAHAGIERLTRSGDLARAREVATAVLDVDPTVTDIERRLISLLWRSGARSAAKSQYEHLVRVEARDAVEVEGFEAIVGDAAFRNTRACV